MDARVLDARVVGIARARTVRRVIGRVPV
jgi:hypothetical protein